MFSPGDRIQIIKSEEMNGMNLSGKRGTVQGRGMEYGSYKVIMDDYMPSQLLLKESQIKVISRK